MQEIWTGGVGFAGGFQERDTVQRARGPEAGAPTGRGVEEGKAEEQEETDIFDVGLLWLVHNDKMVNCTVLCGGSGLPGRFGIINLPPSNNR